MKSMDDFDKFLKNKLQRTEINIADDGFTEKVLDRLPVDEPALSRKLILYFACSIGALIFVVSNGYKSLLISMIDLFSNGIHLIKPTLISMVVISAFAGISFCIVRIEFEKQTI
ncbi:MAG TPA: DUF5056 domain-containing protein [Bacteroidales bacterium]|jgi:hypothetical protein|nr:DUF5056 domain-containing protein [Bacteroidales bacterium]